MATEYCWPWFWSQRYRLPAPHSAGAFETVQQWHSVIFPGLLMLQLSCAWFADSILHVRYFTVCTDRWRHSTMLMADVHWSLSVKIPLVNDFSLFVLKHIPNAVITIAIKITICVRFDCDTTTIRLRRIARACFHSTRTKNEHVSFS